MAEPIVFPSATPRFGLPTLFAGQGQKEFFVNQALAIIDILLSPAVAGERDEPPSAASDGDCWLVGPNPSGQWIGHPGELAGWQSGDWLFVTPPPGLVLHDISTGGSFSFDGAWHRLEAPAQPSGGSTVDSQAREAITTLVATLRAMGIYPAE